MPGDIAYVVADFICDDRRIARIILGHAHFDLSYQIRGDVGGFGVNASAGFRQES